MIDIVQAHRNNRVLCSAFAFVLLCVAELCGHFGPHPAVCTCCCCASLCCPRVCPRAHTCALPVPSERRRGSGATLRAPKGRGVRRPPSFLPIAYDATLYVGPTFVGRTRVCARTRYCAWFPRSTARK